MEGKIMKILFREPSNQPLKLMEIENDVEPIQKLIGGYFTAFPIRQDILCICDEEGINKSLETNFVDDRNDEILGNVIFCGKDGDEFNSLSKGQIDFVEEYIGFPVIK